MLEWALRQERAARGGGDGAAAGGGSHVGGGSEGGGRVSTPSTAASLPPTPAPTPSLAELMAGGPRASQLVIRDYLTSLGYQPNMSVEAMAAEHSRSLAALAAIKRSPSGKAEPPAVGEADDRGTSASEAGDGGTGAPATATALATDGESGGAAASTGRRRFADRLIGKGSRTVNRVIGSPPAVATPSTDGSGAGGDSGSVDVADDVIIHPVGANGQASKPGGAGLGGAGAIGDSSGPARALAFTGGGSTGAVDAVTAALGGELAGSGRGAAADFKARLSPQGVTGSQAPLPTFRMSHELRGHMDVVRRVAWLAPDAAAAAAGGETSAAAAGGSTKQLHVPLLASASDDGTVKVWACPQLAVAAAAIHQADSPSQAPGGKDVRLSGEAEAVRTFRGHVGAVLAIGQVAWGTAAAPALSSPWVTVQQYAQGCLRGSGRVKADALAELLAASSPSSLLVTGGHDGTLRLWLKPLDVVPQPSLPAGDGGGAGATSPPASPIKSSYDLPAVACLPLITQKISASPVWSVAAAPPGIALTSLHVVNDAPGTSPPLFTLSPTAASAVTGAVRRPVDGHRSGGWLGHAVDVHRGWHDEPLGATSAVLAAAPVGSSHGRYGCRSWRRTGGARRPSAAHRAGV